MSTARYLLDTNTLIFLSRRHPKLLAKLRQVPVQRCLISSVSVQELFTGVGKCARPAEEGLKVRRLLRCFEVLPFTGAHGEQAGGIRAALEKRGKTIGPFDLLIAAQAVSQRLTLVTNNTREFSRVPGLKLADWSL